MMRGLDYKDFLRLLKIHKPVRITREHIELAGEHDKHDDEPMLEELADSYPGCDDTKTGGYVLPGDILPWRFRNRLVNRASGMRIYGNEHGMIDEMLCNSNEHGSRWKKDKDIYLLWHRCNGNNEVYMADEGRVEFDIEKKLSARRAFVAGFGKGADDYSGIDILRAYSHEFDYLSIRGGDEKRGTFLRISLREPNVDGCDYIGHNLLAKEEEANISRRFVELKSPHGFGWK